MNLNIASIKTNLCNAFCQDVDVVARDNNLAVSVPMSARDGDKLVVYVTPRAGGFKLSDMGSTFMRLSYEHDIARFLSGPRANLLETILAEGGLKEDDGEIFLEVPADSLASGIFVLGQGLTRIEDLGLWSKSRVESTFYDDLRDLLNSFLPASSIIENYIVPGIPNAEMYPIDYSVATSARPLYLFGVNSTSKARLATIILQHLQSHNHKCESLIVCSNIDDLPKLDRNRMMIAANDVVPNLSDSEAIKKKIEHRLTA